MSNRDIRRISKENGSIQSKKFRPLSLQTSLVIHGHIKSACKIPIQTSNVSFHMMAEKNLL